MNVIVRNMNRSKLVLYGDCVTLCDLDSVRELLKPEEVNELCRKMREALCTYHFNDFESRAAAEKAFTLGYLAAHIEYPDPNRGF